MSRDPQLPEGVPADNKPEAAFASGPETSSDFSAPETATPRFEEPDRSPPPLSSKAAAASRADLMSRQHQKSDLADSSCCAGHGHWRRLVVALTQGGGYASLFDATGMEPI